MCYRHACFYCSIWIQEWESGVLLEAREKQTSSAAAAVCECAKVLSREGKSQCKCFFAFYIFFFFEKHTDPQCKLHLGLNTIWMQGACSVPLRALVLGDFANQLNLQIWSVNLNSENHHWWHQRAYLLKHQCVYCVPVWLYIMRQRWLGCDEARNVIYVLCSYVTASWLTTHLWLLLWKINIYYLLNICRVPLNHLLLANLNTVWSDVSRHRTVASVMIRKLWAVRVCHWHLVFFSNWMWQMGGTDCKTASSLATGQCLKLKFTLPVHKWTLLHSDLQKL